MTNRQTGGVWLFIASDPISGKNRMVRLSWCDILVRLIKGGVEFTRIIVPTYCSHSEAIRIYEQNIHSLIYCTIISCLR